MPLGIFLVYTEIYVVNIHSNSYSYGTDCSDGFVVK